jgi:hypothetical protein
MVVVVAAAGPVVPVMLVAVAVLAVAAVQAAPPASPKAVALVRVPMQAEAAQAGPAVLRIAPNDADSLELDGRAW